MTTKTHQLTPSNSYPKGEIMRRLQCALFAAVAVIGTASIAAAADLPVKSPAFAPAPVPYNWTGIYIGFQGGGSAFGRASETYGDPPAGPPVFVGNQNYNIGGPAAGGVIGADFQTGRTVFGVEGDFNWANINGTSGVVNDLGALPGLADTFLTRIDSYSSVKGRVGYAFGSYDQTLLYFDGGGVWARVTDKYTNPGGLTSPNTAIAATTNTASASETGWTVGVGVEYALYWGAHPTNWTVKAEYNYISLDAPTIQYSALASNKSTFTVNDVNVFQLGVNYRFSWGG